MFDVDCTMQSGCSGSGKQGVVDLSVIDDIELPGGIGSGAGFDFDRSVRDAKKDILADRKQQSWQRHKMIRCDFRPHVHIVCRDVVWCVALWNVSPKGRLIDDIKQDGDEAVRFATAMRDLLRDWMGPMEPEHWAIVTTPRRRHKERNFATLVSEHLSQLTGLPFFPDVATAKNRQRVNPEFILNLLPPQRNLLLIDDIITTGQTIKAMCNLLREHGKTVVSLAGIDNRMR